MTRAALFSALATFATLPALHAQDSRPAPPPSPASASSPQAAAGSSRRNPAGTTAPVAIAPAKVEPAAYYPPPGSLQAPLTAADVCRSLRGGLSGAEVAQDVRERGLVGTFGEDEATDARAAGAAPDFVIALQAGRFTVSPAYAHRYAEAASKGRRGVEANAWRAEESARAQADERKAEIYRQGQLAAENNRAVAAKEWEDKRRFQEMKDKADWESRQRQGYNANDGYYWNGRWYAHRSGTSGHYRYC